MFRPLSFRSRKELFWAKQWLRNQITAGRIDQSRIRSVDLIETADDFNRVFTPLLDAEARQRLQKALSARRARQDAAENASRSSPLMQRCNMEVTVHVRKMARTVAASRGITTSELLESYLEDDYNRLPSRSR